MPCLGQLGLAGTAIPGITQPQEVTDLAYDPESCP